MQIITQYHTSQFADDDNEYDAQYCEHSSYNDRGDWQLIRCKHPSIHQSISQSVSQSVSQSINQSLLLTCDLKKTYK